MKIRLLTVALAGLFFVQATAQKPVNEVTLTYKIEIESSGENPSLAKSFDGATATIYVRGTESRSNMQSSLGMESNLYNSATGKGVILKEYSGQKLMITLTRQNWAQKNQLFQNLSFSTSGSEENVAGFKTRKATATLESGKPFVVYYMPDVTIANKDYNNAFKNIPGIPVKYELESGKLKFTYTLINISYDNIPAATFDIPKHGYRVMTYDENQQLKKG